MVQQSDNVAMQLSYPGKWRLTMTNTRSPQGHFQMTPEKRMTVCCLHRIPMIYYTGEGDGSAVNANNSL